MGHPSDASWRLYRTNRTISVIKQKERKRILVDSRSFVVLLLHLQMYFFSEKCVNALSSIHTFVSFVFSGAKKQEPFEIRPEQK